MPWSKFRRPKAGMGLSEILIVIALLGIIAALTIPKLMQGGSEKKLGAQEKNTVSTLQTSIAMENANLGLLPQQMGPGKVFKSRLKAVKDLQTVNLGTNQCNNPPIDRPIGNHGYELPGGIVVVTGDTWDNYNYKANSSEKVMGRQACLLLKGLNSDPKKGEVVYTTFYRDGQADGVLVSNSTSDNEHANNNTVNNVTNTTVDPLDDLDPTNDPNTPDPPLFACDSSPNDPKAMAIISDYATLVYDQGRWLDNLVNINSDTAASRWAKTLNDIYPTIDAAKYAVFDYSWGLKINGVLKDNHDVSSRYMAQRMKLKNGVYTYVSPAELADLDLAFPGMGTLMVNWEPNTAQAHYAVGSVLNEYYKLSKLCLNDDLKSKLLSDMNILYEANTTLGTFQSPIKIDLKGKDAQVNSDGDFLFATVGFRPKGRNLIVKTAGGLNPDEAWLVADRGQPGFTKKNILDGQDVFGDHLGTFASGYEDLADRYKKFVVKDADDKRYIPIHPLPWWEQLWIWLMRFFGFDRTPNPSYELKLLPRNYKAIPASNVLKAVYVDYNNVSELDAEKQNWVRQRGVVVYRDGHKATGVDQWFQVKLVREKLL